MDLRLKSTALEKTLSALVNIDSMLSVIVSERHVVIITANDTARFLLNGAGIGLQHLQTFNFLFIEERRPIATMHFPPLQNDDIVL